MQKGNILYKLFLFWCNNLTGTLKNQSRTHLLSCMIQDCYSKKDIAKITSIIFLNIKVNRICKSHKVQAYFLVGNYRAPNKNG